MSFLIYNNLMKVEDFINTNKLKVSDIKYKIVKIKDNKDYVVIYLDNKEKINVSIETYFSKKISSLNGLDQNLYDVLKKEEIVLLGYIGALRKLSLKDCSIKQIKDYLYIKKQLHQSEVEEIINKLIKYGLLDDDKYAQNRFNYLNKQLLSIKQIRHKLINEGISNELIDKYVINNNEDEHNKINKLVNKYCSSVKNKSSLATKQAVLNKLVNAGFNYEMSKEIVNEANINNKDEIQLLKKEYIKLKAKYDKKYKDYELRSHIYGALINKGFRSDDIKKVLGG